MGKKAELRNLEEPEMMGERAFENGGAKALQRTMQSFKAQQAKQQKAVPPCKRKRQRPTVEELLQQYLDPDAKGRNHGDTLYFPPEFYEVFQDVWRAKQKTHGRRYKKSFLLLEALFQLPEVVEELRKQGLIR
jgi:hypothetical protein